MGADNQLVYEDFQGSKFSDLSVLYPEEFHLLYQSAEFLTFQADDPVIVEGQEGKYLYLIKSGMLRVVKQHAGSAYDIATISSGDVFGEASVLYRGKAGAEVRAIDDCELYAIPADVIRDIFESNERFLRAVTQLAEKRSAASALAVNPIFSTLPAAVREVALFNAKFVNIDVGEEILTQGDEEAKHMFVILAGDLDVYITHPQDKAKQIKLGTLQSGDEAGEISIVTGQPHMATVIAVSPVRLFALRSSFITAWSARYSDFAYALYGVVYRKLKASSETLKIKAGEDEANMLTLSTMPSLESFKAKYHL